MRYLFDSPFVLPRLLTYFLIHFLLYFLIVPTRSRKTGEAFVQAGVPHVVCVKVEAMVGSNDSLSI